jgi:DNA-directed RNA polymerase subunit M/transcription elongation factor TFIIS
MTDKSRVLEYYALIEKGATKAREKLVGINRKKYELSINPDFGGIGQKTAEIRAEILATIEDDEIPLLERLQRGIKSYRKTVKFKTIKSMGGELKSYAEMFEQQMDKIENAVGKCKDCAEKEANWLEKNKVSGDLTEFYRSRTEQGVVYRDLETMGRNLAAIYPMFDKEFRRELNAYRNNRDKVENLGEKIAFYSEVGMGILFMVSVYLPTDHSVKSIFYQMLAILATGGCNFGRNEAWEVYARRDLQMYEVESNK